MLVVEHAHFGRFGRGLAVVGILLPKSDAGSTRRHASSVSRPSIAMRFTGPETDSGDAANRRGRRLAARRDGRRGRNQYNASIVKRCIEVPANITPRDAAIAGISSYERGSGRGEWILHPSSRYTLQVRRFCLVAVASLLASGVSSVQDGRPGPSDLRHGRGRADAGAAAPADDGERAAHRRASRRRGLGVHRADGARRSRARRRIVSLNRGEGGQNIIGPELVRRARRHPHRGAAAGAAPRRRRAVLRPARSTTASRNRARKRRRSGTSARCSATWCA